MKRNALYLFLDDIRSIPNLNYIDENFRCFINTCSVSSAIKFVTDALDNEITEIWFDLDHDLGEFTKYGVDGISLVNWLVEHFHDDKSVNFKFHFHSMNPVGVQNMRMAISKYWKEFNYA